MKNKLTISLQYNGKSFEHWVILPEWMNKETFGILFDEMKYAFIKELTQ